MIRTGEPNDYAAEILFYLPRADNPLLPKLAHVFVLGEVQWAFNPGDPLVAVPLVQISERGEGWYAITPTLLQRSVACEIAIAVACAGAQPWAGTEIVGSLSGELGEGLAGLITFFLPDAVDPVYGAPIAVHAFTLGEVRLSLPDDAFGDVAPADIVTLGGGIFGVVITAAQAAKRGKAIVVAEVAGAQRFSGYRTILGVGALVPVVPPPLPSGVPSAEDAEDALGDLMLTWSNVTGDADLSLVAYGANPDNDLAADLGLKTAVLLSLFCDRRANDDDVPPSGDPTDRRGWWGDEFAVVAGDKYGSRLWLLARAKRTSETVKLAQDYAREGLAWMLEDKVASRIDVVADASTGALLLAIGLQRPGRDPVTFKFSRKWDH